MIIVEKSRESLQKIDDNLFNQIKRRIRELEDMKKTSDDEDYLKIDEEIRTLRKLQKRLFELRTIKIIMQAWADVCETESGIEGIENMTSAERELYNKLVNLLEEYKKDREQYKKKYIRSLVEKVQEWEEQEANYEIIIYDDYIE